MAKSEFYQEMENYLFNTINIPYTRAVRRGVIKGLTNYNILQNPKYKEAFAITDVFAMNHSRVKSLRHFEKLSFDDVSTSDNPEDPSVTPRPKPKKKATKHANPEELRLMNASLEMGSLQHTDEDVLLGNERRNPAPSPLLLQLERSAQQYQAVSNSVDDDNASVMSSSTNVTRVTGVLISEDDEQQQISRHSNHPSTSHERPTSTERPTSAVVEMRSVFGGSMSDRPPSIHGNPMFRESQLGDTQLPTITGKSGQKAKVKKSQHEGSSKKSEEKPRRQRPSPNDAKHLEEFRDGKPKKKKKDFMNSGKM
jgi:hypothetical protein